METPRPVGHTRDPSYSPRDARDDVNYEHDGQKDFWKEADEDKTNGFYGQKHPESEHDVSPSPASSNTPGGRFYKNPSDRDLTRGK